MDKSGMDEEGPGSAKRQQLEGSVCKNGGAEPKFITERAPILRREKLSQADYDNLLNVRVEKSNYLGSVRGKSLVPGKDLYFFIFNDGTESSDDKEGEVSDEEEDPLEAILPEACEKGDEERPADTAWIDEGEESAETDQTAADDDEEMDQE